MPYTGKLVPYNENLSKVSYDTTELICANEGCGMPINQVFVVPGHFIGKPGKEYKVVRCLNCIFWSSYYTYFDSDKPVRVETDMGNTECQDFLRELSRDLQSQKASIDWHLGEPSPNEDWTHTTAGGSPKWEQYEYIPAYPSCQKSMEFILQLSSDSLDTIWRNRDMFDAFYMSIEHYAVLYFFVCEECQVTASVTQCT